MKHRYRIVIALLLAFSLLLSGCAKPTPTPEPTPTPVPPTAVPTEVPTEEPTEKPTDEPTTSFPAAPGFPVKIGLGAPLSGELKFLGDMSKLAVEFALEQATAEGWDIELVLADTKCDAQEGVSAVNKLYFEDEVRYLVGALCSSASIPISEISEEVGAVQITHGSTNPQVTITEEGANKEYVFRSCFMDPFQGEVMATLADELDAKTAAVLYDVGNDYVKGLAEYFKSSFEAKGGEVVVFEAYTKDDTDFSGILGKVAAEDPDVIFFPDYNTKANLIATQLNERNVRAIKLGGDGWDTPELDASQFEGAYYSTHYSINDPRPVVQDFVAAYTESSGGPPASVATLAYDATLLLLTAISEAGVDDPAAVAEALAGVSMEGVSGDISFNEFGDPIKSAAINQVVGGEHTFYKFVAP